MTTAPAPIGTISAPIANLRSGPGTSYPVVAQAQQGMALTIIGRNGAGDWWQVCCVNNISGWVYSNLLVIEGTTMDVVIVSDAVAAQAAPPPPAQGWRGEYFANRDLQGPPAFVRDDPDLNFRWGGASPGPGLGGVNFSVRWTRTLDFVGGNYTFRAAADDGVRVYLDGWLVIDEWRIGATQTFETRFDGVGAGAHTLTVEYFQAEGDAVLSFGFEQIGGLPAWQSEYFSNPDLQGPPVVVRNDTDINFDWGLGSPDPRLPSDNWSARWMRRSYFDGGNYLFFAQATGGVRLYLDGWRLIDSWQKAASATTYSGRFDNVGAEDHTVVVEFNDRWGPAAVRVWWQRA